MFHYYSGIILFFQGKSRADSKSQRVQLDFKVRFEIILVPRRVGRFGDNDLIVRSIK